MHLTLLSMRVEGPIFFSFIFGLTRVLDHGIPLDLMSRRTMFRLHTGSSISEFGNNPSLKAPRSQALFHTKKGEARSLQLGTRLQKAMFAAESSAMVTV